LNITAMYINYLLVMMELEVERNKSKESLAYQLLQQDQDTINVISNLLTVCLLMFFGGSICKTAVQKGRNLWQEHRGSLRTSTQDPEVGKVEVDDQDERKQDRAEENEMEGNGIEMTQI
jgi:hypothetical protein